MNQQYGENAFSSKLIDVHAGIIPVWAQEACKEYRPVLPHTLRGGIERRVGSHDGQYDKQKTQRNTLKMRSCAGVPEFYGFYVEPRGCL